MEARIRVEYWSRMIRWRLERRDGQKPESRAAKGGLATVVEREREREREREDSLLIPDRSGSYVRIRSHVRETCAGGLPFHLTLQTNNLLSPQATLQPPHTHSDTLPHNVR